MLIEPRRREAVLDIEELAVYGNHKRTRSAERSIISLATSPVALDDVDTARTLLYRLLSHALAQPPDAALLARMAGLEGGEAPVGAALSDLAGLAAGTSAAAARAEYDELFIGVARGELLPYASFYLTGFLHERPLARLRADLPGIGLVRAEGRSDPEDHVATICDVMASLIEQGDARAQAAFFGRHVAAWMPGLFRDLENAHAARLYRPIGTLGRLLIELDHQGFDYADDTLQRGAA